MTIVLKYIRLLFLFIDGSNSKGICNRTWFAIIVALLSIVIDSVLIDSFYDYIPNYISALRGWDNEVLEWTGKSSFWKYEVERIIVLVVMLVCGFIITWVKPKSIIAKRTRCLLAETAMLIITTGVGISMVELALSLGEKGQGVSDYWEWTIMLFWFAISLSEYIHDYRKLKK